MNAEWQSWPDHQNIERNERYGFGVYAGGRMIYFVRSQKRVVVVGIGRKIYQPPEGWQGCQPHYNWKYHGITIWCSLNINQSIVLFFQQRASRIRSVPFTGDSSEDSSDNEDTRATITTNSSHTTSGETESSHSTGSPIKNVKTCSLLSPIKSSKSTPLTI